MNERRLPDPFEALPDAPRPAGLPAWLSGPWGWAALAAALYTCAYIIWTIFHWGGVENIAFIADSTYLPISLFPAVVAGRVAYERRLTAGLRRAWALFALAFLCQFIGNAIWLYQEVTLQETFPSIADFFYLAFFPLLLAGLLLQPGQPMTRGERVRFWVDLGAVTIGSAAAVWQFLVIPTLAGYPNQPLNQWLAASYPIGDLIILLGALVVIFRRPAPDTQVALGFFVLGLIGFLVADILFGYQVLIGTYESGYWTDVGWWVGLTLFGFAAVRQLTPGGVSRLERGLLWSEARLSSLLPLAAAAGMFSLVILAAARSDMAGDLTWMLAAAVLVTVLVLIRQLLAQNPRTSPSATAGPVPLPDPAQADNARRRNATWAALLFALAFLAGGASLVVRVIAGTAPEYWWVTVSADGAAAVAALAGLVLIRRDRLVPGMLLTLGAGLTVILVTASQTAGLGLLLAVVTVVVVSAGAGLTLPGRWVGRVIVAGVVTAVLAVLIDLFGPADRPADPTPLYTLGVVGVLLAIYVFFLARQFRTFSLRAKLAVAFVAMTVIAVGAIAALAGWVVQQEVGRQVGLNLQSIAQAQGVAIGDLLDKQVDGLQTLSLNPLLRDGVLAANQAYAQAPTALAALNQPWQVAPDDDPSIQRVVTNPAALELGRYLQQAPDYVELLITDQYGAVVAATRRPADYYYGDQAWWQTAFNLGAAALGQPALTAEGGAFGLDLAVPIRSADGRQVVGVLQATYDLGGLMEVLNTAQVGETGHADILLPAGGLLSREHAADAFDAAVRAQVAAIPAGGNREIAINGEAHLVSRASVRTFDPVTNADISRLDWTIVADQDAAEAYQPVQAIVRLFVLVGVGALLVAGVLALTVAQTLAGPLARLTAVAARVAAGDLTARAAVEANDETGLLAGTFNSMTAQLHETLTGLERRVGERTRDLALAAEIGQRLAAVRDLEALLAEAVESIRARFELYYTQIYLLDPAGRTLQMQAGTGPVGAQLRERGFRLPVNLNSINGTAVLERRPVIVADTTHSATFRPNALLPQTRSEMAVPLLVGERVVGVLDMQSDQPNALSADSLPAFTALAGQLAIAIENARLFAQAEHARTEIEAQTRRLAHAGWDAFLNAVDRPETVSGSFGEAEAEPVAPLYATAVPITVTGQPIGELRLEGEAEWSAADRALLQAVAERVAQQVENLRLLNQAEAYRGEAEQALRRLTREGWRTYLEGAALPEAFEYAAGQVAPTALAAGPAQSGQPLRVQGEAIGALEVEAETPLPAEAEELLAAVAAQLSAHIENLRLTEATQLALAQTEDLYGVTARLNSVATLNDVVGVIAGLEAATAGVLFLAEGGPADHPLGLRYRAGWPAAEAVPAGPGAPIPLPGFFRLGAGAEPAPGPVLVSDLEHDQRAAGVGLELAVLQGRRAAAFLPLSLGGQWVGLVVLTWAQPRAFTSQDLQLYRAVAAQAAVVVNNRVLFEQVRKRADREAVINAINQKIQSAVTVEAALQTAAQEIGRLLHAQQAVVQLSDAGPVERPNGAAGNGNGRPAAG